MKGRKGSTDEGGVRSPLAHPLAGTDQAGHDASRQIAGAIDLLPTLAALWRHPARQHQAARRTKPQAAAGEVAKFNHCFNSQMPLSATG